MPNSVYITIANRRSGMPNAALSSRHAASLILAAREAQDWRTVEQAAIQIGAIPSCYVITEERMQRARKLPDVGARNLELTTTQGGSAIVPRIIAKTAPACD